MPAADPLVPRPGSDDPHALRERIHETLRTEIVDGAQPPGRLTDEHRTAERLQAPHAPVREAVLTLASRRLLH
ncbi:hypothetical protein [Streptomyces sp. NPDC020362]|uniref:hypothetical protein n=1 Tax=unclassified Streptomyces TaxID=2593676 RepID=UPI000A54A4E5